MIFYEWNNMVDLINEIHPEDYDYWTKEFTDYNMRRNHERVKCLWEEIDGIVTRITEFKMKYYIQTRNIEEHVTNWTSTVYEILNDISTLRNHYEVMRDNQTLYIHKDNCRTIWRESDDGEIEIL